MTQNYFLSRKRKDFKRVGFFTSVLSKYVSVVGLQAYSVITARILSLKSKPIEKPILTSLTRTRTLKPEHANKER